MIDTLSKTHHPSNKKNDDAHTTIQELKQKIEKAFIHDRQWTVFHSPKNVSMNIAIEAAELMEHFLWITTEESYEAIKDSDKKREIAHELADVFIGVLSFANRCNIDLSQAFEEKFDLIQKKYPVEAARKY